MRDAAAPTLEVRAAEPGDVDAIIDLSRRCFPGETPYVRGQVLGQISAFPAGQFVALYDGEVVGYAASFRASERQVFADHSWDAISGGGYAARHNGAGEWLYGMEVCVDPARRRLRIGRRLYDARRRLVADHRLKGVAFGGMLAGYARARRRYPSPDAYFEAVVAGEARDPVVSFQMRNGFEPVRVLHDYSPDDRRALGHAALMVWRNPFHDPDRAAQPVTRHDPETVRVVSVQLQARRHEDAESFYRAIDYFVDVAADYGADFVVFPEYFTLHLLACAGEMQSLDAIQHVAAQTEDFVARLSDMAIRRNVNIIGGSHPTPTADGAIRNVGYVFLRDGAVATQEKLHPTPDEREGWRIEGGEGVNAIQTDCGPVGVAVCYDAEFPEMPRRLADQGARILFVPYCTDTRWGHLRVRYCAQARAIENQCYVVTSGNVGNLPNVENMSIQYAQSGVFTPCDLPFARDGIAAEASENVEMVIVADLNLATIQWARAEGAVRNLRDRRSDLYRTRWSDGG